jgi:2,3-bisphosphoglycerate-independent phosphoglycerate mutase
VRACEAVDECAQSVITTALANDYTILVIADHGNSDMMINEDGTPNTAHTTNLVPLIMVDDHDRLAVKDGKLGDLAPTILKLMGVPTPEEMTGDILLLQ